MENTAYQMLLETGKMQMQDEMVCLENDLNKSSKTNCINDEDKVDNNANNTDKIT